MWGVRVCICVNEGRGHASGNSGCAAESLWGECEYSVKRDIMQVQCVKDIFTLRIHMYINIDGIVGIRFSLFL